MWPFRRKSYFATPERCEFIADARIERGSEGDYSHTLIVEFVEPVRDGNEVSHYNILYDGQAVGSANLFTGETKIQSGVDPVAGKYDFVFANEDKQVLFTDRIRIVVEA